MGLVHYGLVPSRKKDSAMLALYQGRYSQAFMGSLGSPQSAGAQETVIELGYRRRLGTFAFLQRGDADRDHVLRVSPAGARSDGYPPAVRWRWR